MKRYDFGLNWSGTAKEKFVTCIQSACKEKRLSFLWISQDNSRKVLHDIEQDRIRIRMLLDTEATYNKKGDLYARICYLVKDKEGIVINDPDRTKVATDKSVIHYELINAGILIPYTVIVRNWQPNTYCLPESERKKLGIPFIIKPALGYGQHGVIRDAHGTIREIATARHYDRGDNFLLQEKIIPIELTGKRAWFRVFNLFNRIIPCWWDDKTNLYKHVHYEEFNTAGLYPIVKIVAEIAAITRMAWFSTEIAIDIKNNQRRYLAIDYVNDQCDMTAASESPSGVPDTVVEYTAQHIITVAHQYIHNVDLKKRYFILLKDATVEIRGLGSAPELLKPSVSNSCISDQKTFSHKILRIFHNK